MHVISRKKLREFWAKHKDAEQALKAWFHEAVCASWENSAAIKARYVSASIVSAERVVFNVCGNKYRLVVAIRYDAKIVLIRFVGTHKEYSKVNGNRSRPDVHRHSREGGNPVCGIGYFAPDWIPAFAGMSVQALIVRLQTGACYRERLR